MLAEDLKKKGNAALNSGNIEEAIKHYTEAIKLNPTKEYYGNRSLAYTKINKFQEALADAEKCVEADSDWSKGYQRKGFALNSLRRYGEAVQAYQRGLQLEPNNAQMKQGLPEAERLAKWEEDQKKQEEKAKDPKKLMLKQEFLKDVNAWYNKGIELQKQGKLKEAIECYDEALKLDPKFVLAWNGKGIALQNQGKLKEAIECYDEALKLDPKDVLAWNNKGNALTDQGKLKEAIECYDEALKLHPKDVDAWYNKGIALQDQGKLKEAIECYDEALKLHPKYVYAWNGKGVALKDQGKLKEAIECFDEALKLDPKYVYAWNGKGVALRKQVKLKKAIECYDEALKLDPKFVYAWNGKGDALQKQGKLKEAIECYDEAIKLHPKYSYAWNGKGFALQKQGKLKEAIECFDEAIKLYPKYIFALNNKALALDVIGKFDEAEKYYLIANEMDQNETEEWVNIILKDNKIEKGKLFLSKYIKNATTAPLVDLSGQVTVKIHIPYSSLTLINQIGCGSFGIVHKGIYQHIPVAIKLLQHQNLTEKEIAEFQHEVTLMISIRYPYIVQLYGACFEIHHYALVMEYMSNGDLYQFLRQKQTPPWSLRYKIAYDISLGLSFLHLTGIIHSDLKSLNILLNEQYCAKITDFGLSKLKSSSSASTIIGNHVGGSLRWMAPELLIKGEATSTKMSDVYSFGMVLWELGSLNIPFRELAPTNEQIYGMHFLGKKETISTDTPPKMTKLIIQCWEEKEKRPDMEQATQILKEEYDSVFQSNPKK